MNIRENVSFRLPGIGLVVAALLALVSVRAWSQNVPDNAPPAQIERTQTALPDAAREVVQRYDRQAAETREQYEKASATQRAQAIEQLERLGETYAANGLVNEVAAVRQAIQRIKAGGQPAGLGGAVLPDPGNVADFRDRVGQSLMFDVTGSTTGTIWGDGVYTDDSPVATVAVHAGVLRDGERGVVAVTIRPGRDRYPGGMRNGVASQAYGGFGGSYEVKKTNVAAAGPRLDAAPAFSSLRGKAGEVLYISLTGSTAGVVWGSDVYTDDSALPAAAVHAGVLKDGESGVVRITIAPADDVYTGSIRNGVETQNYGEWGGSFRIERVPEGFVPPKVYRGSAPANRLYLPEVELRGGGDLGK